MTPEENIVIVPIGESTDSRRVWEIPCLTWFRSVLSWGLSLISVRWRDETSTERAQRLKIADLEIVVKSLTNDLDYARHEISIAKVQLAGIKAALVYHEERWKAMAEIAAIRGSAGGRERE